MKRKVLILTGFYTPSVKGGGPIQSIKNLVDNFSNDCDFYIITSDRDLGDKHSFSTIEVNKWVHVGKAKVYYISPKELTLGKLNQIINDVNFDLLYLNGFFIFTFSIAVIILNKFKKIKQKQIIIAPRGEFSKGALALKRIKKKLYIKLANYLGLYNNVIWHATAETEKEDIKAIFGEKAKIQVANNLTPNYKNLTYSKELYKVTGTLKIVFISRIHPKKNLKLAIDLLNQINGKIKFSIYGPMEDKDYWSICKKAIEVLPKNIDVSYKGLLEHENVLKVFKEHHVFLFPTLGENFGHVISEALMGGCPVIISDQTPWRGLNKLNVGWDIPLTDLNSFTSAIQYYVDLNNEEYQVISKNAFIYGKQASTKKEDIMSNFILFNQY